MNRTFTFGILGGYGATGKAVGDELRRSSNKAILVGGHTRAATETAALVDIRDPQSLDQFCSRCSIIVNCSGPVCELQDLAAQAAFRNGCHYVDVAGLTIVRERMAAHHDEIAGRGLSFVVSAGWIPGLLELVPAYSYAIAASKMDRIRSVNVYFGDSGEWSDNALRDAAWYLHKSGLQSPHYLREGKPVPAKTSDAFLNRNFGSAVGRRRVAMFVTPELAELSRRLKDCDVRGYSYMAGYGTAIAGVLVALLPLPLDFAMRLLRRAVHAPSLPVGGFVAVEVEGSSQGRDVSQRVQVTYEKHRDYWINGLVAATAARLISEAVAVKPGVNFLADAVDPVAFMEELRGAGMAAETLSKP